MKFRIALFGGTGFIGSYVLDKLLEQGFLVNVQGMEMNTNTLGIMKI